VELGVISELVAALLIFKNKAAIQASRGLAGHAE
jgi:hypothetical protein